MRLFEISQELLTEAVDRAAKANYSKLIRSTNSVSGWDQLSIHQQDAYRHNAQIQIETALKTILPIIKQQINNNLREKLVSYEASYCLAEAVGKFYNNPEWTNSTTCSVEELDTGVKDRLLQDLDERNSQIETYQEILPDIIEQILAINLELSHPKSIN